ncbi:unnamed protein product [Oncorhynchus mykiss]|uniref:Retinoblastoma-associated protein A-box domain-containing protein n=1 Tax=Oncorhynchus mykiss TaxID=8022 RepID=A0A060W7W5_ONCMY|nr:unnamed protein product [Oncorhynchus mykiss]
MCQVFCQHFEGKGEENAGLGKDIAVKYFRLAEALYYKTLEAVIDQEKERLGDTDLSGILEQDVFQRSLLACCLEIVIFSYRPPGDFPRVIHIFQLPAYHFYKIFFQNISYRDLGEGEMVGALADCCGGCRAVDRGRGSQEANFCLKKLALAFLTACVYLFLTSLKSCISQGLFDANAERHRMFLCWSRADRSGVNQGLYLFLVLHFLNGACLFKMVRKALLMSFQDIPAWSIRKACLQKSFRERLTVMRGGHPLRMQAMCVTRQYVTFSPFCLCVIEVLVRAEQGLFREVVKHLNQVEEQVLESLAWRGGSPLWDSVREAKNQPPACQEVMPPQHLEDGNGDSSAGSAPLFPNNHGTDLSTNSGGKGVSPSPTTLLDRYSSPPTGSARRRLFVDASFDTPSDPSTTTTTTTVRTSQAIVTTTIPAGQTVVTMATATVTANNGQTVTIPVQGIANENGGITFIPVQVSVTGQGTAMLQPLSAQSLTGTLTSQPQTTTTLNSPAPQGSPATSKPIKKLAAQVPSTNKPQKKGSLSLFFRKVYHMASVRLRDLCAKLDISSELRRKIWTCFEYSLVQCTELMMDRHLDQLLMCAVYVMTKVGLECVCGGGCQSLQDFIELCL